MDYVMILEEKNPLSPLELDAWASPTSPGNEKETQHLPVNTAELYSALHPLRSRVTGHWHKAGIDANTVGNNI